MKNSNKMALSNCYCGQSGDINLNMLECSKCRRWFHEDCVKCLDLPMLLGDRFYTFICSVCNAGSECLGRLELQWEEVAHLLLYNMTLLEKRKYFHLSNDIVPFLQKNWERFHLFGSVASEKKDICIKLLQALEKSQSRFKCGREVKKCKNIWALRIRAPPDAPNFFPSAVQLKKDVIVWDFPVKDRAYHILSVKKSTKNKENVKNGRHKSKSHLSNAACQKNEEVSKCRESVPHNENEVHKTKHKNKRTTVLFNEDSACSRLLDSLIPFPPDFNNCNNPFLKSNKRYSSKRLNSPNDDFPPARTKRRRVVGNSSNLSVMNGNKTSDDCNIESTSCVNTKEESLQRFKDFQIIGKRITSTGKTQYLFQRNSFVEDI